MMIAGSVLGSSRCVVRAESGISLEKIGDVQETACLSIILSHPLPLIMRNKTETMSNDPCLHTRWGLPTVIVAY